MPHFETGQIRFPRSRRGSLTTVCSAAGQLLAPAKTLSEMNRIVFNDYVDAALAALFVLVVVATVVSALISIWKALGNPQATAMEIGLAGTVAGGRHA
jgi:hypothetical protein